MRANAICATIFLAVLSAAQATEPLVARQDGCPAVTSNPTTTPIEALPNPFLSLSGEIISKQSDWACRRNEISVLMQEDELGMLPPPPDSLTATFASNTLSITPTNAGTSITFNVSITYPASGTGPFPAIIGMGGVSIPIPDGIAVLKFDNTGFAAQTDQSSRGVGLFFDLFGSDGGAGAMIAWAWGVSRIIDALEMTPSANIDLTHIGVSGCSRNGKGALVAGAFEERIALTIPQESGSGGSACWRLSNAQLARGEDVQGPSEIVQENVWLSTSFNQFANNVDVVPFDHHMLAAMVAPRPLFVIENTGMVWLGNMSTFGCMTAAHTVWQALQIPDMMGFSQVGNHNHCQFPSSQQPDLDAYINKFLFGQPADTAIFGTDGGDLGFNETFWIDWSVPNLD